MVLVVGVDVHKGTHTAVVVDAVGRELGQRMVPATDAGHRQLLGWVLRGWPDAAGLRFAVEIAGMCRPGWNGPCWAPGRWWCGCRRS